MGGEFADWVLVAQECARKKNLAVFSHWDWDHIGLVSRAAMYLSDICRLEDPGGIGTAKKIAYMHRVPSCAESNTLKIEELLFSKSGKSSNGASRIFVFRGVLLPGDSGTGQEKKWAWQLARRAVRVLALGHHGSRTSTSQNLLENLAYLKIAVASARERVYGHPHWQIKERLRRRGISLIRTEIWGNVMINVP